MKLRPHDAWAKRSLDLYRLRAQIASHPDHLEAWTRLAQHYEQDGDSTGAVDAWSHVLTLAPADGKALTRVVEISLLMDRHEQAARALDLAMVHAPGDTDVLGAAVLLHTTAMPDLQRALDLAQRRVALTPESVDAQTDLAMLLMLFGQPQDATSTINTLLDHTQIPEATDRLRLHVLRLAAGLTIDDLAAELHDAYTALPPQATAIVAWALLAAHVDATQPPGRAEEVLAVFEVLQQPRSDASDARLRSILSLP